MIDLRRTEVDGVDTVWMPVPGPLRGGLVIRVGTADETLPTRGITHLLEHLALHEVARPGDDCGGLVDQTRLAVHATGDATTICRFLDAVTRRLARPPLDRLDDELGILAAEAATRPRSVWAEHWRWRYGATSYGLAAFEQVGLRRRIGQRRIGGELVEWSRRFANRRNAVLWLSGPPPAGLRLHLPDGSPQAPPDPWHGVLTDLPAWFTGHDDAVALDCIVPRGPATSALAGILRARLVDDLRVRRGIAYSPDAAAVRLTGGTSLLIAATDVVRGRAPEAVRPFLSALHELAGEPGSDRAVQQSELDEWVEARRRSATNPASGFGVLDSAAWNALHGMPAEDVEGRARALTALRVTDVARVAREAVRSMLAQVPSGLGPHSEPWRPATSPRPEPVTGREFRPWADEVGRGPRTRMVLGPAGVTLRSGERQITVRVAETAAVLRWTDGAREIIGLDGVRIAVEPAGWRGGSDAAKVIDDTWPVNDMIDMGPRSAPEVPNAPSAMAGLFLGRHGLWWLALAVTAVAVTVTGVLHTLGADSVHLRVGPLLLGVLAYRYLGARREQRLRKRLPQTTSPEQADQPTPAAASADRNRSAGSPT